MDFDNLNDELKAKAKACTSPEELLDLAREEGFDLSDEELETIAGGWMCGHCPTVDIGDERDDINEAFVSKAFMTGELRGDELD